MICVLCQRREAERAQACDPCRLWLPTVLRDIGELHATLDVTARSNGTGPRVSGSREAPVPLALDVLDLAAAARLGSRGPHARGVLGDDDQIGHLSVATDLEFWVIDWIGSRNKGEHRPEPTVSVMIGWLGDRLDDACDQHPAIDEFAADVRRMRSTVRRYALGRPELPELCDGVACSSCDWRNTLYRHPGSQWRAECGTCGNLYTDEEYERWTGLLASWTKGTA